MADATLWRATHFNTPRATKESVMHLQRSLKILVAGSLALSSIATAATSASVTLSGSVASTLSITSTDTAGASALDLSSGEKIVKVADLSMNTNNDQGLTLTATSGNLSKTGGVSIAFQVTTVADAATAPLSAAFTVASGTNYTVSSSTAGTVAKDLYIKYTPGSTQDPGTYSGSISLTVADN